MKIKAFILTLTLLAQSLAYSSEVNSVGPKSVDLKLVEQFISNPDFDSLSDDQFKLIKGFIERYTVGQTRVKSCPLESTEHMKILNKIETIRALFQDNCLDSDQERLADILDNAQAIQGSLNNLRGQGGVDGDGDVNEDDPLLNQDLSVGQASVNGQQIANVFNNINSIFLNGQCQLDRGSFLAETADIIQAFAQMGLLVPNQNGLIVSAGGIAMASILRAIDNIFTTRFDFENIQDRQTFVKLNCAFYDLRNDILETGMLDIPTQAHQEDFDKLQDFKFQLNQAKSTVQTQAKEITSRLKEYEKDELQGHLSFLKNINSQVQDLYEVISTPLNRDSIISSNTNKMRLIQEVGLRSDIMIQLLNSYIQKELSSFEVMDRLFLKELEKYNFTANPEQLKKLMAMEIDEFEKNYLSTLIFHTERMAKNIENQKVSMANKWKNETFIAGKSVGDVKKILSRTEKEALSKVTGLLDAIKSIDSRLSRILDEQAYQDESQSTENLVYILEQYDEIVGQVYGKWGYEFVDYTSQSAHAENKDFEKRFKTFAKNYLNTSNQEARKYGVYPLDSVSELEKIYACQDALPFRRSWKLAEGLVRQSFDFLMTNRELFHGDAPRGFLGFRREFERLQNHYRSSFFAQRILNGDEVSGADREDYLERRYTLRRRKFTGKVMLEVEKSRSKAGLIQEVIEKYQCHDILRP